MFASATLSAPASSVKSLAATNSRGPATNGPLLSIGRVASKLGLSPQTLRAAHARGELRCFVLPSSNHRRFALSDCLAWLGHGQKEEKKEGGIPIAAVIRVSSAGQNIAQGSSDKSSLEHQRDRVASYIAERWGNEANTTVKWYKSVGSGLNFERPAFLELVSDILAGHYKGGFIVCTDFSRLCRFGLKLFEHLCKLGDCQIVYTMDEREAKSTNEALIDDILGILTHFTAKASGAKTAKLMTVGVSPEKVKYILELSQRGYSIKAIVAQLVKDGLDKDERGRSLTVTVVTRVLHRNAQLKEAIVGPSAGHSFARFAEQHIRVQKVDESKLVPRNNEKFVQHKTIMVHFKQWAQKNGEHTTSNHKVQKHLTEVMGVQSKINWRSVRIYYGVSLIGLDNGIHKVGTENYEHHHGNG